jgi:hypothetical protein
MGPQTGPGCGGRHETRQLPGGASPSKRNYTTDCYPKHAPRERSYLRIHMPGYPTASVMCPATSDRHSKSQTWSYPVFDPTSTINIQPRCPRPTGCHQIQAPVWVVINNLRTTQVIHDLAPPLLAQSPLVLKHLHVTPVFVAAPARSITLI